MTAPLQIEVAAMRALIHGVARAVPAGGNESDVTTVLTRPMWRSWCRAVGWPEDCEPTEWLGIGQTRRVYGSRTIIVPGAGYVAASFATP
jgi:hypothetical protein